MESHYLDGKTNLTIVMDLMDSLHDHRLHGHHARMSWLLDLKEAHSREKLGRQSLIDWVKAVCTLEHGMSKMFGLV